MSATATASLPYEAPSRITAFPPLILPLAAAIFIFTGIGPNTGLAIFALAVLLIGCKLLWRPGEPPILLFVFCYQWMQASISIFYSNATNADVSDFIADVTMEPGAQREAIILTLIALLFLAVGMRWGAGRWQARFGAAARSAIALRPVRYWFRLYAIFWCLAFMAQSVAWVIPGLAQLLLGLASVKWVFYWLLCYATFVQPGAPRKFAAGAFLFELVLGIGGYFSDFKTVFFFTLFALLASGAQLSRKAMAGVAALGLVLVVLGVLWTAIKLPYRELISGHSQTVSMSYSERIQTLGLLLNQINGDVLQLGGQQLINRITYVEFFATVLRTVPAIVPHANGALWSDALMRPFTPRLFFPGKTIVDDSARTALYTDGAIREDAATSISIGYVGEAYIDFGKWLMMLPIFALGFLYGKVQNWLVCRRDSFAALGMGLATNIIFIGMALESSVTKVLGGVIVTILLTWILIKFFAPGWFGWMRNARQPGFQ